jgi:hypothetical protein
MRNVYRSLVANLKGSPHLEDIGVDGNIILKSIFRTGFIWLRIGTGDELIIKR